MEPYLDLDYQLRVTLSPLLATERAERDIGPDSRRLDDAEAIAHRLRLWVLYALPVPFSPAVLTSPNPEIANSVRQGCFKIVQGMFDGLYKGSQNFLTEGDALAALNSSIREEWQPTPSETALVLWGISAFIDACLLTLAHPAQSQKTVFNHWVNALHTETKRLLYVNPLQSSSGVDDVFRSFLIASGTSPVGYQRRLADLAEIRLDPNRVRNVLYAAIKASPHPEGKRASLPSSGKPLTETRNALDKTFQRIWPRKPLALAAGTGG